MIYPIRAFGDPVLRKKAEEITEKSENLDSIIDNMWETMYASSGVGLAAPQVGMSIRLFIVDSFPMYAEDEKDQGMKEVFINPEIISEVGDEWEYEEGCLSIPHIREMVRRKSDVTIKYKNQNWEDKEINIDGMTARVIQHEFDHLEGVLFTDLVSPLTKQLLNGKLKKISQGKVNINYKMKFHKSR